VFRMRVCKSTRPLRNYQNPHPRHRLYRPPHTPQRAIFYSRESQCQHLKTQFGRTSRDGGITPQAPMASTATGTANAWSKTQKGCFPTAISLLVWCLSVEERQKIVVGDNLRHLKLLRIHNLLGTTVQRIKPLEATLVKDLGSLEKLLLVKSRK
jgi:hypothetical protein